MTDVERLIAKHKNAICVEERTTRRIYFNCFGEKIDEDITTKSEVYIFDSKGGGWKTGLTGLQEVKE